MLPTVDALHSALTSRLAAEHSLVGYNLAAMRCMARSVEQKASAKLFESAIVERRAAAAEEASVMELRRRAAARATGKPRGAKKRARAAPSRDEGPGARRV